MEYLTLTFITAEQSIIVDKLIALSSTHNCRVQESRICFLGSDFAGFMHIAGNWNDVAKLEKALVALLAELQGISLTFKRTGEDNPLTSPHLPYLVQVVGLDTPAIVNEVAYFFVTQQTAQIVELQTDPFQTNHSNTTTLTISMRVNIPANISISDLRERFMTLCEELNIDGIVEPEKR